MKIRLLSAVVIFASLMFVASAQSEDRTSLGLKGCSVNAYTGNSDGSFVMVACEGPKSLFYSKDFGATWIFAGGGVYTGGTTESLSMVGSSVYAQVGEGVIKLDVSADSAWKPEWTTLANQGYHGAQFVTKGSRIYVGNVSPKIKVFNTTDGLISEIDWPADTSFGYVALGADLMYVLSETRTADTTTVKVYRASIDASSGLPTTAWEDITANVGATATQTISKIAADPEGDVVYAVLRGQSQIEGVTKVSKDEGATFNEAFAAQANNICISGQTHLVGTRVTNDGATSFTTINEPTAPGAGVYLRFEDGGCYIPSADNTKAFMSFNQGPAKVTNLNLAPVVTSELSITGLEVMNTLATAKAAYSPEIAFLGTSGGLAFSETFTSDSPSWLYPICPGGDCVGGRRIAFDPQNDAIIFYASGNMRKGTIQAQGVDPRIQWTDFVSLPVNNTVTTYLGIDSFSPNRVVVTMAGDMSNQTGGVYFYNKQTGEGGALTSGVVNGKPISTFIALSDQVMYAAIGAFADYPDASVRGLARSFDGGVTWEKMSSDVLSTKVYVTAFAYDGTKNVLYAASTNSNPGELSAIDKGAVLMMENPFSSSSVWVKTSGKFFDEEGKELSGLSFTALTVDSVTGYVFVTADNRVFSSSDQGASWGLLYKGLKDETTNVLSVDEKATTSSKGIGASSTARRLTQGATTGVYGLDPTAIIIPTPQPTVPVATPTATPVPGIYTCSLSAETKCKKTVKKGTQCKFTVQASRTGTKKKQAGIKVQIERSYDDSVWSKLGNTLTTNAKGVKDRMIKVTKTASYRATCAKQAGTPKAIRIKVKK